MDVKLVPLGKGGAARQPLGGAGENKSETSSVTPTPSIPGGADTPESSASYLSFAPRPGSPSQPYAASPRSIRRLSDKFSNAIDIGSVLKLKSFRSSESMNDALENPRPTHPWTMEADAEDVSFWTAVQTVTFVLFAILTLTIVLINANDFQGAKQDQLVGTTVEDSLRVQSHTGHDAVFQLQSGTSADNRAEITLDTSGDLFFDHSNGDFVFTSDVISTSAVRAKLMESSDEGIIFPDGTRMTTAAASVAGVSSPGDINIVAGTDATQPGGAILMITGGEERVRVTNAGTMEIRGYESASTAEPVELGFGVTLEGYPPKVMVGGTTWLHVAGLKTSAENLELASSTGRVKITKNYTASEVSVGLDGVVQGGDGKFTLRAIADNVANATAAPALELAGGPSSSANFSGGHVLIDGGAGGTPGDILIGTQSGSFVTIGNDASSVSLAGGHVELSSEDGVRLSADYVSKSHVMGTASVKKENVSMLFDKDAVAMTPLETEGHLLTSYPTSGVWTFTNETVVYSGTDREVRVHLSAQGISLTARAQTAALTSAFRTVTCNARRNGDSVVSVGVLVPPYVSPDAAESDELLSGTAHGTIILNADDILSVDCGMSRRGLSTAGGWAAEALDDDAYWSLHLSDLTMQIMMV
uniref:Uncharacterized protein n=1 Tax=Phaeomonas parva TaxID=124430 RepID=A0A7S1TPW1_9STRA|mmetsp:Transcript_11457/g.34780  ORF Transcript_11457/g.34780 Transcript_11457/m.34780 type:complete len:645 (+) Transcript_11457:324-2258(+)